MWVLFFSIIIYNLNSHISATYTNLENHPRLIRVLDSKPVPKIALDRKTGLPSLIQEIQKIQNTVPINTEDESEDSDSDGIPSSLCCPFQFLIWL